MTTGKRQGGHPWVASYTFVLIALLAAPSLAHAQYPAAAPPAAEPPPAPPADAAAAPKPPAKSAPGVVQHDSPRASLIAYLTACREGRYADAARYLELAPADAAANGPRLAKRLKIVFDRYIWFDPEKVSPESFGDPDDKLAGALDELGTIPNKKGSPEPVRMVRVEDASGPHWAFSAAAVARIDAWYQTIPGTWLREYLPDAMFRPGWRELLWWQWAALPLILVLAFFAAIVLTPMSKWVLAKIFAQTKTDVDDKILARIGGPLRMAWTLGLLYLVIPAMDMVGPAATFMSKALRAGAFLTFFWTLSRAADIVGQVILASPWSVQRPEARPLLSLAVRAGKIAVLVMAIIAVLSEMGYPVASLIAGLGIGGLAFALAAQKTVENVFGSISIGMDQPMREGEFVRVEDFVGTVESIGLRSTRFRTLDRTMITIPNGKLADMRLETFAARDRIRFATTIGLIYTTRAEQMRAILAEIEKLLRAHPKTWPDAVVVRFKELGTNGLELDVMCWFMTSDYGEFSAIKQDLLLEIMSIVHKNGSDFAFPTQTVHVVKPASP
jgi:MscS family membrane protein